MSAFFFSEKNIFHVLMHPSNGTEWSVNFSEVTSVGLSATWYPGRQIQSRFESGVLTQGGVASPSEDFCEQPGKAQGSVTKKNQKPNLKKKKSHVF